MYERLQSPVNIGRLALKNRCVLPAMGVNLGAADGSVTEDIAAYYEARARGGAGLIITEVTRVMGGNGVSDPCQLAACRLSDVASLQRLVEAVHSHDAKIFIQLQHPGWCASPLMTGEQPVAASDGPSPSGGREHRALTTQECGDMVQRFAFAAKIAQMAGADGVELHAAHGYLINEFLSPAMNSRADQYGGCFDNRMRFLREIIAAIRKDCGKGFPLSARINAEEALPGGIDLAEAARIAAALEAAGADAINVSCYSAGCIEPGTYAQGWKKYMAQAVKKAVTIPVIATCNIKDPAVAESLLEEGCCDLAAMGRAQLADADWCRKAFSGREAEIRRCIGCLACFGEIVKLKRVRCAVNPLMGRERDFAVPLRDGAGRAVAVIGGGPAGIEAALTLKSRGFAPVLFDENPRLGGTLNVADRGWGKEKITRYVDSLIVQLEKAGVETRLNEHATPKAVKALNPCGVFVACGAEPLIPPIEGARGPRFCTAEDVLLNRVHPSGRAAVIGSGMTGLETAEMLALAGCELTLVEMLPSLGPGMYPSVVEDVMGRINPHNPRILTGHRLMRITPEGVDLTRLADGSPLFVPADWTVLSLGVRPRKSVADAFRAVFPKVQVIGDARQGGRVLEATQDAHDKAFVFEP